MPLIAGRDFNDNDKRGGEPVVIISQSAAQRMFPGQDPINRHIMWTDPVMKFVYISPGPRRIVGVVADVDDEHIEPGPMLTIYHPFGQVPDDTSKEIPLFGGRLFVHTRSDPHALIIPLTRIIRGLSSEQPVEHAATLEDIRAEVLTPDRLNTLVFSGTGGAGAGDCRGRRRRRAGILGQRTHTRVRYPAGGWSAAQALADGRNHRRCGDGGGRHFGRRSPGLRVSARGQAVISRRCRCRARGR